MYRSPSIDTATICFAISMYGFLMSGIALSARRAAPGYTHPLGAWSKSMFAAGVAFLLYFFRGHAPWLLTFVVANSVAMLVPAYGLLAQARLFDRKIKTEVVAAITMIGIGAAIAVPFAGLPIHLSVALLSGAGAVLLTLTALLLARVSLQRKLPAAALGALIAGIAATGYGARSIMSFVRDSSIAASGTGVPPVEVGSLLPGLLFVVGSSMAFFTMVHSCQRDDLLETMRRDFLTGVYTRGAFFELATAHARQSPDQPYAIVMVDVDHFKAINDRYEHRGGDLTLAHIARQIAGAVRLTDIVGRYGGEEFCILLPSCDASVAARLANRVVEDARKQVVRLDDGRTVRYTLSAGYAMSSTVRKDQPSESLTEIVARADRALYQAKRSGRDRALLAESALLPMESMA